MSITNVWDALSEFKNIVNNTKSIQVELRNWGDKVIQFIMEGGEDCSVTIRNGRFLLEKRKKEDPDLTFTALDGHLVNLFTSQTDYTSLDIVGNIKFEGNNSAKHKFIAVIGLLVSAPLGEVDEFDEL